MKTRLLSCAYCLILSVFLILVGCDNRIERSGFVIDETTKEPIEGVTIEVYLKAQKGDSLTEKIFTDSTGYFHISEKRDKDVLFEINKRGYISQIHSLSIANDTIRLERSLD